ncbi:aspartate/glutamate racemase family protein [Bradyrhizobium sp. NAS96.2]|uniref:aspartate/glutamate racemase family protein n=1 Tax=Bradyrhizobium sp. NAS96.2 TaxID=1680160 RepID=UPI000940604F|nr:aspartate/glutamate racemase family protein [Bradyrhizobium sp. NAS96.2]OKO82639.1 Asp/Glu/hydantoin racemase [Bradyrhizobium sp. NAS96.2]
MRILIVNPNTTAAMTEKIGRAGRAVAAPGTEIIAVNPADGPVSIEGYYDEAFSVPGLLAEIAKGDATGVSAHVIACFDDTGLEAARCVSQAPVIGIGEAAFHLAAMLGHRFTVVTTLSRSIAAIENNLLKYGLASRCAKVRACEVPVLSLDDPTSDAAAQISAEIERSKQEDHAEVVVLGCAGMADLAARLSEDHGLPVIDGVASAVKLAEAFGTLGLRTSKIGAYAQPRPKPYLGSFAPCEPR